MEVPDLRKNALEERLLQTVRDGTAEVYVDELLKNQFDVDTWEEHKIKGFSVANGMVYVHLGEFCTVTIPPKVLLEYSSWA